MKEINTESITSAVARLCIETNCCISPDMENALRLALEKEESALGKNVLETLLSNAAIARDEMIPICQDTGLCVVFVELGMDLHITGGDLEEAIQKGIIRGYTEGFLRSSIVADPIDRSNTGDNSPGVVHYKVVSGDKLKITVAPKGFGSENMGGLKMLTPSAGIEGIKQFVIDTVSSAGSNPCPPIVVGVGVGGSMEKAALIAKEALLRPMGSPAKTPYWKGIEEELLGKINDLGIGPGGFGGRITALAVHIETYPTHIAGLPVAVNLACHVHRHGEVIL